MSVIPDQAPIHRGALPSAAPHGTRPDAGLIAFLLSYPLLIPLSFYATWLVGRGELGYWPAAGIREPGSLGGATVFAHGASLSLVVLGLPLFAIACGVACHGAIHDRERRRCLACAALAGTLLLAAGITFLAVDPNHVAEWFFD